LPVNPAISPHLSKLFGYTLRSNVDFPVLPEGSGPEDLIFERTIGGFENVDREVVYSAHPRQGAPADIMVLEDDRGPVVRFTRSADYLFEGDTIRCRLLEDELGYLVRIHLFGMVMALWMELRGIPVLHASGVVVGGRAVGFLAKKTGGKTSLAAAMVRAGYHLLSDDLLPLEATSAGSLARPSYPQFRMEPDAGQHFVARFDRLPIVHPSFEKRRVPAHLLGEFQPTPAPLAAIYVPQRVDDGDIEISPIPGAERLVELLRESFLPEMVAAFGLEPQRLRMLGNVAKTIPIKRLRYPAGFDRLPEVVRAIEEDVHEP
jgi:hypothetical protein